MKVFCEKWIVIPFRTSSHHDSMFIFEIMRKCSYQGILTNRDEKKGEASHFQFMEDKRRLHFLLLQALQLQQAALFSTSLLLLVDLWIHTCTRRQWTHICVLIARFIWIYANCSELMSSSKFNSSWFICFTYVIVLCQLSCCRFLLFSENWNFVLLRPVILDWPINIWFTKNSTQKSVYFTSIKF